MLSRFAEALGKGLIAGIAGTAAISATMTAQRLLQGEPAIDPTPARAVANTLRIGGLDERGTTLLAAKTHWEYGVAWGLARALLGAVGLRGRPATVAHLAALHGAAMALLPRAGVAPPASRQPLGAQLAQLAHHAVYAAAAGSAYDAMTEQQPIRLRRRSATLRRPFARLPQHDARSPREQRLAPVGGDLA